MSDPIDHQIIRLIQMEPASHLPTLPAPGVIWWKAQLLERRRKQQKALLPVRLVRKTSIVAICAAVVAVLYIAVRTGAIKPTLLGFAGILFLSMYLPSIWIHWRMSSRSNNRC
jgi:hypothetical protein